MFRLCAMLFVHDFVSFRHFGWKAPLHDDTLRSPPQMMTDSSVCSEQIRQTPVMTDETP
uniref:Uncharacterized protein n=1 Tax=Anopheles dirus TaxID=7168 RepID=A0A182NXJ6_9DIPT